MRPVRVIGHDWVVSTQIGPDPICSVEMGMIIHVDRAKRLAITCHTDRVEEIRAAVRVVSEDPDSCPHGEEFDRIMQVYLKTPV